MRYASIRDLDISNGTKVGVALFVQGCDFHCADCFNSDTWDFNGGEQWTIIIQEDFLKLIDRPFIKRCSILGGEPLHFKNITDVYNLCKQIKETYPDKTIWLYTGYKFEDIYFSDDQLINNSLKIDNLLRKAILQYVDILVDGRYEKDLRDMTLAFRGSSNQRVIDVQNTLTANEIVLYEQ